MMLTYIIKYAIGNFSTHARADEVEEWFKSLKDAADLENGVYQAINQVRGTASFLDRTKLALTKGLKNNDD